MAEQIDEPVVIDDAQVLETINAVRERVGWEPLSSVPKGDPTNGCACVFGRSWAMLIAPDGGPGSYDVDHHGAEPLYEFVDLVSRVRGPNGPLIEAIAEVTGGELVESTDWRADASDRVEGGYPLRPAVRLPGSHPLMRWMWQFDHERFDHLLDGMVGDPLNDGYEHDFTVAQDED